MRLTEILSKFEDVTEESDDGYLARCPGHSDSKPSLRIWCGDDGKVRLTCRAGCEAGDVVAAAGLRWNQLFDVLPDGATVPREKPALVGAAHTAALANYIDETSSLIDARTDRYPTARVAREYLSDRFGMDSETAHALGIGIDAGPETVGRVSESFPFRSRAYAAFPRLTVPLCDFRDIPRGLQGRDLSGECPGRWVSLSNPKGHRWGQYGVFRGQGGYGVILVTEGPGDGLTGVAVGYDVVMVRGAALAGSPELIAELAAGMQGYQVIACGDIDDAGARFNRALAEGLKPHGITVYGLVIPDHGPKTDLTAWREAGPDTFAAGLHAAVKAAQPIGGSVEAHAEAMANELADRTGADVVSRDDGLDAARIMANFLEQYGKTDAMNAYALVAWCGGVIKYAPSLGFLVWNGRVWEASSVKVRQGIHRMGAALMLAGRTEEARSFAMTQSIDNILTELRSVPSVYADGNDFDARPHLLSFRNGTVDLRTGKIRPHSKEDMLTYCLDLDYNANARADRWEKFLEEIFPGHPEMPAYIRRLVGYGITGHTSEQCFTVLWGKGANGKSVLTDTLTAVFRNVSKTTPFATFEDKGKSGGIPNDIAALRGARLVMASEGESGKPMSEGVLKRVTGKDMISARFLRKEFFEFKPSFLLMLATNHKPKFRGQDEGLWRRVKMIPFERYFAPHERDFDLDAKLTAEAQGIAAWAVRGAVEWFADGLRDPDAVTVSSREYRATSDALAGFFPGVLVRVADAVMNGSDAFNAYLEWAEAENLPQRERWTRRQFYDAMEEREVFRKATSKGVGLVGVADASKLKAAKPAGPGIFSA